jgi:L-ribulose-5-phosphate 3-epimerase
MAVERESVHVRLAAIGDEAGFLAAAQVNALRGAHVVGWEVRSLAGTLLHEVPVAEVKDIAKLAAQAGLEVPVIDTPLGNGDASLSAQPERDLELLTRYAERAGILGCRRLRVMSYPSAGRDELEWGHAVVERLRLLTGEAESLGVTLLHENCTGWASQSPAHSLHLLDRVGSPALRLLFDTGNGVWYGYDGPGFLERTLDYVDHVHVKDATRVGAEVMATLPGHGSARLAESLDILRSGGYTGWLSLEPHLLVMPHRHIVADDDEALAESFHGYVDAFTNLLCGVR